VVTIGFGPTIKNVAAKSCPLATVGWQKPPIGNDRKN